MNVLAYSFASLVDTLDAFATIDARKDDATDSSMEDDANISFISYLNGAVLLVLSIDCRRDDSLFFVLDFFWGLGAPGTFGEEFLYVVAKLITPVCSNREIVLKPVGLETGFRMPYTVKYYSAQSWQ